MPDCKAPALLALLALLSGCASSFEFEPGAERTGYSFDLADHPGSRSGATVEYQMLDGNLLQRSLFLGSFPLLAVRFANSMEERIRESEFEDNRYFERYGEGRARDEAERIRALLLSESSEARRTGLSKLRAGGPREHYFLVVDLLRDPDDQVRAMALHVLASHWDPASFPRLVEVLSDPEDDNRVLAAKYLVQFEAQDAVPALVESFRREEGSARVRAAILRALAAFPEDRRALATLVDALADPDKVVCYEAIERLSAIAGDTLGYDAFADESSRRKAAERWRKWLSERR